MRYEVYDTIKQKFITDDPTLILKPNGRLASNDYAVEYSGIEMAVNRQGMLRVRVLDDDGSFTTQDIIEIRNCPLCGKRFMKGRCV